MAGEIVPGSSPFRSFQLEEMSLSDLRGKLSEYPLAVAMPLFGIKRYDSDAVTGEITGNADEWDSYTCAFKSTFADNENMVDAPAEEMERSTYAAFMRSDKFQLDYIPEYKGICVGRELVHVPTKRYVLVQHAKVFAPVMDALEQIGVETAKAKTQFTSRSAYMYLTLPDKYAIKNPSVKIESFHKESEQKGAIEIGLYAKNSFDGSGAMEVGIFGVVQVCGNGMIASRSLGTINVRHTARAPADQIVEFVKDATANLTNLETEIQFAMSVGVTRDQAEAYFRSFFGTRALARVMKVWDSQKEDNAWGLHSAITNIVSHERANPKTFHEELSVAENILIEPQRQVELANGLIIRFKEEDEGRLAAKKERERQNSEKMLRKAEEKAQKARDALMAPENAEEVDFGQADPLPSAVPTTNPGPFGVETAVEVSPVEDEPESVQEETLHPDLSDAKTLDDLPSLEEMEKADKEGRKNKKNRRGK